MDTLIYIAIGIAMCISTWVAGVRMRRRIRRSLGRKASDLELTSIHTWLEVEDAEQKQRGYTEPTALGPKYH